jgi:wyosine [tRNA(Phe)-imidazoG37] synthetase (radical SAM superfamily)
MMTSQGRDRNTKKFVYGPVPSRRLGISLGVDVVPFKHCSYDCIYCQLGRTTQHTTQRRSFVPIGVVMNEIEEAVNSNDDIDYITFSGSGEPTLNSDIGAMIMAAEDLANIPVAVITNGSLLWKKAVRSDLSHVDLVVPSVDGVSEDVYQKINHPVRGLDSKKVLKGIRRFCQEYDGRIFVEIMLVKGVNDSEEEIGKINDFVGQLRVDKIQLNTVVRPPGRPGVRRLDQQELLRIKGLFDPRLPMEIIAGFDRTTSGAFHRDLEAAIIELLGRRPTKKDEMAAVLGVHPSEMMKYIQVLEESKKIKTAVREGEVFYTIA